MKLALPVRTAGWLYLLSILLVISLGSLAQLWNLAWGLILTEVFCILLPVLLYLRWKKIPIVEGLRLRPLQPKVALLSVALGVSVWVVDAVIDSLMIQITGQPSVPIAPEMLPDTTLEGIVYFLALAVFAPLCEEALFRGALQGSFERARPVLQAITFSALLFAVYHMRLTGLPALLPVAFLLGYVVWRTQSLWAGVLVHFGNNALAGAVALLSLFNPQAAQLLAEPTSQAALGIVVLAALAAAAVVLPLGLRLLRAWVPAPAAEPALADQPVEQPSRWPALLPALGGALVALVMAVVGFVAIEGTAFGAAEPVRFSPPKQRSSMDYIYQIVNIPGEPVGEARCQLEPAGQGLHLECDSQVSAYDTTVGQSRWASSSYTESWQASWDAEMHLTSAAHQWQAEDAEMSSEVWNSRLTVHLPAGTEESIDLPTVTLLEDEWAWRLMFLDTENGSVWQAAFAWQSKWDEAAKSGRPALDSLVAKLGAEETIRVPAGEFKVRKLALGKEMAAWYTLDEPRQLVRYSDGFHIFELVSLPD